MSKKLPVLIALALILAGSTGVYAYQKPVSFISIDINPSIELGVNVFDVVVSAEAYNDDGEKVLENLDVEGGSIEDAIQEIVDSAIADGYVEEDDTSVISITTETNDGELAEELKEAAEEGVENALEENETEAEIEKDNVALERRDEARELGITPGKLNLIQKLQVVNPDVKIEDFKEASVKEIMAATHAAKGIGPEMKDKVSNGDVKKNENATKEKDVEPEVELNDEEPIVEGSDQDAPADINTVEALETDETVVIDEKEENSVVEAEAETVKEKTLKENQAKVKSEKKSNNGKSKGN